MKLSQVSMTGGEISPALAMRVDLARYTVSLKGCLNCIVRPTGGASNRPGTQYVSSLDDAFVLIPFVFNADQAYVLAFGDEYVKVFADGQQIGDPVDSPYSGDDIDELRFTQSADVLTLTHPDFPPHEFRRLTATTFSLIEIDDFESGPFLDENTDETVTIKSNGLTGSVTLTASASLFTADHIGSLVRLSEEDLSGVPPWEPSKLLAPAGSNPQNAMRRSDGKVYICVTDEVATGDGTYTGTIRPTHDDGIQSDGDGSEIVGLAKRAGLDWEYVHSGFGIARITAVASGTSASALVLSRMPESAVDPHVTSLWAFGAWSPEQGYPSVCTYYQDRLVFAASPEKPQTEWASKTGKYHDFGKSSPLVADDSITQTLNARQINEIRELVPLDQLVALTATSSWASPRRGETWTPETIGFDPQAYDGAAALRSVLVGDTALYADRFATKVRDLRYQFEIDKFAGNELTVMARHLFGPRRYIADMDYAREPHGILWCARSDGVLAGLTYLREHDVIGWHRHTTRGLFKKVCVIPENNRDTVYFRVERVINGSTVQFLERLTDREIETLEDGIFMDAALSYDGRITDGTSATLSGSTWNEGDALTCTLSGATDFTGNLPDELTLRITEIDSEGIETVETLRLTVTALLSPNSLSCTPSRDVPEVFRGVAITEISKLYDTYTGLSHLEGEAVAVLADGAVEEGHIVQDGAITLQNPAAVVHVGLGYVSDIETLNISVFSESVRDRAKRIPQVSVVLQNSRGVSAGANATCLEELPERNDGDTEGAGVLINDTHTYYIANTWNENGRVLIRQRYPLPMTVLAIMPEIKFGTAG